MYNSVFLLEHAKALAEMTRQVDRPCQVTGHLTGQVTGQVSDENIGRILKFCNVPLKAIEIQSLLGLKHRETFQNNYLKPLLNQQLLIFTIPDKPKSKLQCYVITEIGKGWVLDHANKAE
jgi:hypothetical protein